MKKTDMLPRHFWLLTLLTSALMLVLMGLYWHALENTYRQQLNEATANARLRAEEAAHALSRQMYTQLKGIDFIVQHLGEHWQEDHTYFERQIELVADYFPHEALQLVAVTDASGRVVFRGVAQTTETEEPVSLADRAYFREHKASAGPHFSISLPVRNLYTGDWTLQFSHSLIRDGRFEGIVLVSISAHYLAQAFKAVYPDADDVVLLTSPDGEYLTRSHRLEDALGTAVLPDRSFLAEVDRQHGFYDAVAPVDGFARFYSWYRLDGYPVVLTLGLGKDKVLGPVLRSIEHSRKQHGRAIVLLLVALAAIVYQSWVRARQSSVLVRQQERLSTLLAHFPAGVLLEDEHDRIVSVNRRFCIMLGLPPTCEQLAGQTHAQLLQQLPALQAGWFGVVVAGKSARKRSEVATGTGHFYEISQIAIHRNQRSLGHVWLVQDISERKHKEHELITQANTDPLTGLPNRRSFQRLLEERIPAGLLQAPGAVLMLDIDHFKQVNDTWGHLAGDEVLKTVARVIHESLREQDHAGRLGGEEFAILLDTTSAEESLALAERVRQRIAAARTHSTGHIIQVTISIGLCLLDEQGAHSVLLRADRALYQAKAQGRNCVCVATADMA